jgi:HEPN domain-containing protein
MATKLDAPIIINEGKELLGKAEAELAAGNYGMAAYYANRSADTVIKGIMLQVTGNDLNGHSVATNCRQTSHFHKKLMSVFPDCAQLEKYWVDIDAGQVPKDVSKADAEKAVASAKKIPPLCP